MVAPAESRIGTFDNPPCPLPPELRSDIAYRRAHAHPWDALGVTLHYHPDALRRACENDPDFAAAQARAWEEATWEGQADGMNRLRRLANGEDDGRALKASEVLLKYAAEQRRDATRLAVEKMRAEAHRARAAAQQAKAEAKRAPKEEEPAGRVIVSYVPATETDAERQARFAREHAERAAEPEAEVYLWGGTHPTGISVRPDASDVPYRVFADWSCGCGPKSVIYWVAPAGAKVRGGCNLFPEDNPDLTPAGRPGAA